MPDFRAVASAETLQPSPANLAWTHHFDEKLRRDQEYNS
jgi:hypothetical protein